MWLPSDDDPRQGGPTLADERTTVLEYLRVYRLTLRLKCDGLTPEQLAMRSVPPSTLSLLGLVRHMANVEDSWFRRRMAGEGGPRLYTEGGDRDGDFNEAVGDADVVAEAFGSWESAIAFADELVAAEPDLGAVYGEGEDAFNLRDILVHMVEEYARHCGHADLLRECIDGRTGQ